MLPLPEYLGTLRTRIHGGRHNRAVAEPGDRLELVREPQNRHDARAVAIMDGAGERVGHLGASTASWLAPLLDGDLLEVTCRVPHMLPLYDYRDRDRPLLLECRLTPAGQASMRALRDDASPPAILHRWVAALWEEARTTLTREKSQSVAVMLTPLDNGLLLPETRLLLALVGAEAGMDAALREFEETRGRIREELLGLEIGGPVACGELTFFPLLCAEAAGGGESPCLLLDQALAEETAQLEEIGSHGRVPGVLVVNESGRPVLAREGLVVQAPKQNRVVNISVLIAPRSIINLGVCCVERGRWSARDGHEREQRSGSPSTAPSRLRWRKLKSMERECAGVGGRSERAGAFSEHSDARTGRRGQETGSPDQSAVWEDVDLMLSSEGIASPTHCLSAAYEQRRERMERLRAQLSLPERARGFIVGRGDRLLGLELFDTPAELRGVLPSVIEGYLIEALGGPEGPASHGRSAGHGGSAGQHEPDGDVGHGGPERPAFDASLAELDEPDGGPPASELAARWLLERAAADLIPCLTPVGLGTELRLSDTTLAGTGVWFEGRLRQLTVLCG